MLSALKTELLLIGAQSVGAFFDVLVVCHDLQKYTDVVVNGSNIEIATLVASGLEPFVVDCFSKVA